MSFEQPIIPPEDLIVGEVYYGWKPATFTPPPPTRDWYFFKYLGDGQWGPGGAYLKNKDVYLHHEIYSVMYSNNTNIVNAITHIHTFPEEGNQWNKESALEKNRTQLQKAIIAAANWWKDQPVGAINFSEDYVINWYNSHFGDGEVWYNKNPLSNEGEQVTLVVKAKVKKKYKIINCSQDKQLFKEASC